MIDTLFTTQKHMFLSVESFLTANGMLVSFKSVYIPALLIYLFGLLVAFSCLNFIYPVNFTLLIENFVLAGYTAITRRIHLPKHRMPHQFTPSISFMGGGHLWMFAIGVGHFIFENFDIDRIKFLASSSGCFAAVPLACGMDPYAWCHRDWAKCMNHFDSRMLGCLCDSKYFYYNLWDDYLPPNAHERCSGRLFISITLFPSMRNKVISHFETREDLIWVIVASMCLPIAFIRDFPVQCGGKLGLCFDGGFSNDSPCLDSYTITVSALHREADIKPAMDLMSVLDDDKTAEEVSDYDVNIRIRAMDVMRTPEFSRVWQVAGIGERSAVNCVDFKRHEWVSIRTKQEEVFEEDEGEATQSVSKDVHSSSPLSPTSVLSKSVLAGKNGTKTPPTKRQLIDKKNSIDSVYNSPEHSSSTRSAPITPVSHKKNVVILNEASTIRTRSSAVKLRSGTRII